MITKTQKEILNLLKQGLTPKDISFRRKTTERATRKTIKKLKDLGLLSGNARRGFLFETTCIRGNKKVIRLHGQEFNLRLKTPFPKDISSLKTTKIDENTIRFYSKSIEIYSKQSFYGYSSWEARQKSIDYFRKFFQKLRSKYNILFKVRQVNAHYSEEQNEIAKDYYKKKQKLAISSEADNKIWAKIDFSLSEHEFETIHPETAEVDINKVTKYFNDIRDKPSLKPSELTELLTKTASNQDMFNTNLVKHFGVLDNMNKTMDNMNKTMKAIQKSLEKKNFK